MPKNITVEEIATVLEDDGIEFLLSEHMNPEDARDSRVKTVLRAIRKSLNELYRLVDMDQIRPITTEDAVDEDIETDDAEGEIDADFEDPDGED